MLSISIKFYLNAISNLFLFTQVRSKMKSLLFVWKCFFLIFYSFRNQKYGQFIDLQKRIIVTNDLLSQDIDFEKVNIVINYDMPENSDIYLHRVKVIWYHRSLECLSQVRRIGSFGNKGLAINFVSNPEEDKILKEIQIRFVIQIKDLPENI